MTHSQTEDRTLAALGGATNEHVRDVAHHPLGQVASGIDRQSDAIPDLTLMHRRIESDEARQLGSDQCDLEQARLRLADQLVGKPFSRARASAIFGQVSRGWEASGLITSQTPRSKRPNSIRSGTLAGLTMPEGWPSA